MGIKFDERDYYNPSVKRNFLEFIRKDSDDKYSNAEAALKFMRRCEALNGDLYTLDKFTIVNTFKGRALSGVQLYISIYNLYKAWAKDKFENVDSEHIPRGYIKEVIEKDESSKFISNTFDYNTLILLMNNPYKQNLLPLVLAFEGIMGEADNYDIYNLKIKDIDFSNGIVELPSSKIKRQINTDFLPFIRESIHEEEGKDYNISKDMVKTIKLMNTEYVCKCSSRMRNGNIQLKRGTLNQRLAFLKVQYPDLLPFEKVTTLTARNSGILFYLFMIDKFENKQITNEIVFKAVKRYDSKYSSVSALKSTYELYKEKNFDLLNSINISEGIKKVTSEIINVKLTEHDYELLKGLAYANKKDNLEVFEFTDDFDSDWVNALKIRGTLGEKYILDTIKSLHSDIQINKVKDKYGFDLLINNPYLMLEVKTTTKCTMTIHLSKTEIERGLRNPNYKIIVIMTDDFKEDKIDACVINNTDDILVKANAIVDNSNVSTEKFVMSVDSVSVKLTDEFIKKQQSFSDFQKQLTKI